MIKGILLDYGGTIDTNGHHWGEVIWNSYCVNEVPVEKQSFREAYRFAEYSLATVLLIKPADNFLTTLEIKIGKQIEYLIQHHFLPARDYSALVKKIAGDCNQFSMDTIQDTSAILKYLNSKYPLVLVSNFYGNIQTVLENFGIKHYFKAIVESAVVGIRKPNPAIFSMGVASLQLLPDECVVIGDSYEKDIIPGKQAGCNTIWLKGKGWDDDPDDNSTADRVITDFKDIEKLL